MLSCGVLAKAQPLVVCPIASHSLEKKNGRKHLAAGGAVDLPSCTCATTRTLSVSQASCSKLSLKSSSFFSRNLSSLTSSRVENGRKASKAGDTTPRAAVAVDAVSTATVEFQIDGGAHLKVKISGASPGSPAVIELEVYNSSASQLVLHWGATKSGKSKWYLPSRRPADTRDFQNQALQTPFLKDGNKAYLTVELADADLNGIEFLLKEDNTDRWFKNRGGNFRVDVPRADVDFSNISVPEDLCGIQAYLRWERNGKQNYSPEQEQREYAEARKDLQREVASGVSIEDIRRRFGAGGESKDEGGNKDNHSSKKTTQSAPQKNYNGHRVSRKRRDPMELLNKYDEVKTGTAATSAPAPPREPTPLEMGAEVMEGVDSGAVVVKKIFKLGGSSLLVLVTNPGGEVRVRMATDMTEPVSIHWGLSKVNNREWQAPPESVAPENSTLLEGSCETPLKKGFAGDESLQSLEIVVGDAGYIGMPFVLKCGGNWYKDNGGDYYVSLKPVEKKKLKALGDGAGTARAFLEEIANQESEAQRSLMHRYNIAVGLASQAKEEGELALAGILVWLRYMATRQLIWNKNYNVKPREISAAQEKLTDLLQAIYRDQPQNREVVRLIMSTVGRGGQGDVGQRIRDEILVIQRNNDCKGGMMEEWHQKLHNNTSPDDVVICQALLDHIQSGFDMNVYWKTLNDNGVTKERMRSYDRPIVSEPNLRHDQRDGLIRDLTAYMRTLKAVHSGADLESAVAICMGYSAEGQGFMGGVNIHPISGLSGDLPGLLRFVLEHIEDHEVVPLLEGLLEARRELRANLLSKHDRLRDIIFLDLALDSSLRTAVERGLESLGNSGPADLASIVSLVVENLALSSNNNEELVYCLKDWYVVIDLIKSKSPMWALRTKAVLDRTRLALQDKAEHYQNLLQPTAEYLGTLLGVENWAMEIFTEEMIRSGSAASLSLLLNRLDPVIRKEANMGSWQVISPVETKGVVVVVDELLEVEDKVYDRPTILVAGRVRGEEEIPDGAVAVLTPDMPDILSHVSVRARNGKICFATCFDSEVLANLRSLSGKAVRVEPTLNDLKYSEISESELSGAGGAQTSDSAPPPRITLTKKKFIGKYAIPADDFNPDMVGAKSRNIAHLRGKLPSWIKLPTSVALPFGSFEKVLAESINQDVAKDIAILTKEIDAGDFHKLKDVRETVLRLQAPPALVEELKKTLEGSNMPWPGSESKERWEQAWTAIKKVWGSKWNERAYFSTRKVKIDHNDLSMAVLVQEIIQADYAFVIHTTNPSTEDSTEIYAEVVKGLGETLVGAYSGRALSFVAKKSNVQSPQIIGFPSKRVGLFIKQSIIFRSDSNGEDLEGYAGAGLYDSVPMDTEDERVVDYSTDALILDEKFRSSMLAKIAAAGLAIEELYGTPQDIEGVIKDGELYVVQTRPQM
ncbi:alpha-glucan, water dikinase [Marchantia polymorpha subsp. ruderalis]|uniref:Pyruvate phosphate dikinase AMP/ATP-binding domain-containing protein n=2 Tax=Marchantia polymorpha TaxID=3197 RepID=A0AAF6BTA6_MARPO|nr:hypothetical protein MARPO_0038s0029 [Marchantia polymorpha]BBN15240.1 hypothetical protein Mp_6g18200 [Marchantia polymorpha subsp. ruderalis]|eukprot:PTQ40672.1 hypothetical protein MARPO_0038s0029 [Marchantia polymorpha]